MKNLSIMITLGLVCVGLTIALIALTNSGLTIRSVAHPSLTDSKIIATASGSLIADNFQSAYDLQLVKIRCNNYNGQRYCISAITPFKADQAFETDINILEVVSWDSEKVVATNEYGCVTEFWVLDLTNKITRMESHPKSPDKQVGDCSHTDSTIKKSHIGAWTK